MHMNFLLLDIPAEKKDFFSALIVVFYYYYYYFIDRYHSDKCVRA